MSSIHTTKNNIDIENLDDLQKANNPIPKNEYKNKNKNWEIISMNWGTTINTNDIIDIGIASDCFYDKKEFHNLIVSMASLIWKNPKNSLIIISFEDR